MSLKPWYTIVTPREDIRENKSLDMAEFAVHLDHIRDGRAPEEYQNAQKFFERTYLTQNLTILASEMVRRLSGETNGTSAVFNMATQFGGGKTHALTLLYHLAKNGSRANKFTGVRKILDAANIADIPQARTAVFVGTEFDVTGRGGEDDGTPHRRTAWGEIAFQLGSEKAFAEVAYHDENAVAPGGDIIRKFLPENEPCLILMDEIMNYVSRARKLGAAEQFYNFIQNLSEEARARHNLVLCVSLPASIDTELNTEDQQEYIRIQKLLDRLGKPILMSEKEEISEIIRRRLFEWDTNAIDQYGRVLLPSDAVKTCNKYGDWTYENRVLLGFEGTDARSAFVAAYPFHPSLLSVFERKWASLPNFQRTRGVLRMLALWIAKIYDESYRKTYRDPLITLGTAPLDDSFFRTAVFEQLGERRLEVAVTSDITGRNDSNAVKLDTEAVDEIKKARLHRKVATTIFFESNGGQGKGEATLAEIRMATAQPDAELGNIETVLQSLTESCYYLNVERNNKYRFGLKPNLNMILAARRANITATQVETKINDEIQNIFAKTGGVERIFFPTRSNDIPDRAAITLVVLPPELSTNSQNTLNLIDTMTRECGASARVFKSALIWCGAENPAQMKDDAKKLLAWESVETEASELRINEDETQRRLLNESLAKAKRDFSESVFRSYKTLVLLGRDNSLQKIDLGLITSSSGSLTNVYLNHLRQNELLTDTVSPNFLARNWSPAFREWNTRAVRDAFFSSPQFPRLMYANAVKEAIAKGVIGGLLAYIGKLNGGYEPFAYNSALNISEIEISEDAYIITRETAEEYLKQKEAVQRSGESQSDNNANQSELEQNANFDRGKDEKLAESKKNAANDIATAQSTTGDSAQSIKNLTWEGDLSLNDWNRFYSKVLNKLGTSKNIRATVKIETDFTDGVSANRVEEVKSGLRELNLSDDLDLRFEE